MKKKLLFLLVFISLLALVRTRLSFYDLNRQPIPVSEIEIPSTDRSIIDGNVETGWACHAGTKGLCDTVIHLQSPQNINLIEVYFSIGLAKNIEAEYLSNPDQKWTPLTEVKDNNFSHVTISTPALETIKVSSIRFKFEEPISKDGLVSIGEIRAFQNPKINAVSNLLRHIFMVKREPLSFFYYTAIFISIILLVGFGAKRKPYKQITPLNLALIWLRGIVIFSLLGVVRLATGSDGVTIVLFTALFLISSVRYLTTGIKVAKEMVPLLVLSLVYLFNLLFFFNFNGYNDIKLIEKYDLTYDNSTYYPTQYGSYQTDFQLPYAVAKIWKYRLPLTDPAAEKIMTGYKPSDRTPLLSLFSLPFLVLFGDRHFIFEIISIVISPAFLIGFWVALSRIFNKKVATMAAIFLVFNHWIFFATHFGQVRLLVIFFLSLLFYYSFDFLKNPKRQSTTMIAITATLAFLSHPFAIVYIVPVALYQYFYLKLSLKTYLLPLLALILWRVWSGLEPGNSLLVSSMVSGSWENTNKVMHLLKPIWVDNFQNILQSKFENFLGVFLPNPRPGIIRSFGPLRTTIFSAVGIALTPLTVLSIFVFPSKIKSLISYLFLAVIFFTTIIFLSFYAILGLNWYHVALVPLLIGTAATLIYKMPRLIQVIILLLSMIEFYYVTYVHFSFEAGDSVLQYLIGDKQRVITIAVALILQTILIIYLWRRNASSSAGSTHQTA